jgi:PAS domain S-box-containing protein
MAGQQQVSNVRRPDGVRVLSAAMHDFAEATTDYPRLLQVVARSVATAIGDTCIVLLLSKDGRSLDPVALYDPDAEVMRDFTVLLRGGLPMDRSSMARDVMLSGVPRCIPQLDLEDFEKRTTPEAFALHRRLGTRGLLVVPLRVRGEPIGSLSIVRYSAWRPEFEPLDVETAHDLANHAAMAISNSRLVQEVKAELALRIAAEDALRQSELLRLAEQEAARANRFLDAIIENIPDMIFVKDAETLAFTRLNRAGEDLLGISRADLTGKTDRDFFPKEQAEFFQDKDRQTLASGVLVDVAEEPIETPHGRRWLHTKKVPIVDADGTPRFLLGISHDITDRKRAIEALRDAKEETDAANRELEAFSYSVAHDLRAPLRAIDGFSQALLDDYDDKLDAEGKGFLGRVKGAAQSMAMLIDALLSLSRVVRSEMARAPVDLSALARQVGQGLREAHGDRVVELVVADGMTVEGDARLLAVVMENLLGNAWKYTRTRAVAHVEVGRVEASGGRDAHYFVRDDGVGFDMQYADKLFDAFQRLHEKTAFEGSGIGLATVMRIIRRHGGRIWAEGAVDRGATFFFEL